MKRALEANVLISRLIDADRLLSMDDVEAEREWEELAAEPGHEAFCKGFCEGIGYLEPDNAGSSWVVWAVYEGLLNALVAVSLGLANLDTPVPAFLPLGCSSAWEEGSTECTFVPLRHWLLERRPWISSQVAWLFHAAGGEEWLEEEWEEYLDAWDDQDESASSKDEQDESDDEEVNVA